MSKTVLVRPESGEYAEYYGRYIGRIEDTDIVAVLQKQLESAMRMIAGIDPAKGGYRYAPGKWSVKDLLGHIIDTERVFSYRALVFSRNDSRELPGFDQEPWAENANFSNLSLAQIASEFESVRRSTVFLFQHLAPSAWSRPGIANNNKMTVRAAAYVIAGHADHHFEILRSRYLGQ